ncbi:unnamed protein product, partial [Aureobasidium pullulans]
MAGTCLDDLGVIVVIVPYRKLVDETVRNARAKGINYIEPKLAYIDEVRAIGIPLILLIVTLPVYIGGELEAILDIDKGKLREITVRVISKIISRLRTREKVIVYYKTIAECEAIAKLLGCSHFYAGYVDKDKSL